MDHSLSFLQLLSNHKAQILGWLGVFLGAQAFVASIVNKVLPHDKGPGWLHRYIDWAAALAKKGMVGIGGWQITIPYVTLSKWPDGTSWSPPAAAVSLIPFFFLLGRSLLMLALLSVFFALPGCPGCSEVQTSAFTSNWKTCTVGSIPQEAQNALLEVGSALLSTDWQSGLDAVGKEIGDAAAQTGLKVGQEVIDDQVDCLVQATVASWQAKLAAVKGQIDPRYQAGIERGQLWLSRKKASREIAHVAAQRLARVSADDPVQLAAVAVDIDLFAQLRRRDRETVDLVAVARELSAKFGEPAVTASISRSWAILTANTPEDKAHDVFWIAKQPARVQDLAWLIAYRTDWLPAKANR